MLPKVSQRVWISAILMFLRPQREDLAYSILTDLHEPLIPPPIAMDSFSRCKNTDIEGFWARDFRETWRPVEALNLKACSYSPPVACSHSPLINLLPINDCDTKVGTSILNSAFQTEACRVSPRMGLQPAGVPNKKACSSSPPMGLQPPTTSPPLSLQPVNDCYRGLGPAKDESSHKAQPSE